jgi:hypothetical protein
MVLLLRAAPLRTHCAPRVVDTAWRDDAKDPL